MDDLGVQCCEEDGHSHGREKLSLYHDADSSPTDQRQANPRLDQGLSPEKLEAKRLSILRCIDSLVHVSKCKNADCQMPSNQKMRGVIQHTRFCKLKETGDCSVCKQLIALCCYHAKYCQDAICPVPFCLAIKRKLQKQQLQQKLQQAELLVRHMAVMNSSTSVPTSGLPGNSASGGLACGAVSPASVMSGFQGTGGVGFGIPCHQLGVGLKLGMQTAPENVLQVVNQVNEEAALQQASPSQVGCDTVDPSELQVMPPSQMQRTIQMRSSVGGTHFTDMNQWTPRYPSDTALQTNPGLQQHLPNMIQPQQPLHFPPQQTPQTWGIGGDPMIVQQIPPGVVGAMGNNQYQKATLEQLLPAVNSSHMPEQGQQILSTNCPQKMVALIQKHPEQAQAGNQEGATMFQDQQPQQYLASQEQGRLQTPVIMNKQVQVQLGVSRRAGEMTPQRQQQILAIRQYQPL